MKRSSWSLICSQPCQNVRSVMPYHRGVWPPLLSVSVFLASFPSLAAQYGSCLPIVFLFGKFFALSTITTNVPISGPSTVMSAKMPAVWAPPRAALAALEAILKGFRSYGEGESCLALTAENIIIQNKLVPAPRVKLGMILVRSVRSHKGLSVDFAEKRNVAKKSNFYHFAAVCVQNINC